MKMHSTHPIHNARAPNTYKYTYIYINIYIQTNTNIYSSVQCPKNIMIHTCPK